MPSAFLVTQLAAARRTLQISYGTLQDTRRLYNAYAQLLVNSRLQIANLQQQAMMAHDVPHYFSIYDRIVEVLADQVRIRAGLARTYQDLRAANRKVVDDINYLDAIQGQIADEEDEDEEDEDGEDGDDEYEDEEDEVEE